MGSVLSNMPALDKPTCTAIIAGTSAILYICEENIGNTAMKFLHLGSISTWFGTQIWVTFVAGVIMFTTLPRQMFGLVQSKLFPKYFLCGTLCSSIALTTYAIHYPVKLWLDDFNIQGWILSIMLISNIANCYVIEPVTTAQMFRCHKYEREHEEMGQEVGVPLSEGLRCDPKYMELRDRFFKLHGISSVVNMVSLGCSFAYLWYLQQNYVW